MDMRLTRQSPNVHLFQVFALHHNNLGFISIITYIVIGMVIMEIMEIMVIMVMMVIMEVMVNLISLLYRQLPRGRHISE